MVVVVVVVVVVIIGLCNICSQIATSITKFPGLCYFMYVLLSSALLPVPVHVVAL